MKVVGILPQTLTEAEAAQAVIQRVPRSGAKAADDIPAKSVVLVADATARQRLIESGECRWPLANEVLVAEAKPKKGKGDKS